jgi:hypothetical protein
MFYCHHEHPFTKVERIKVYFSMFATAMLLSTVFMPPSEGCESWLKPKNPAYAAQHTRGRIDVWSGVCESGLSTPDAQLVSVLIASVVKVSYGSFLEYIAFCPCFVDYVGAFKDRTEFAGAVILNSACMLGIFEIILAIGVISQSPLKGKMIYQIANTIIAGIVTGWLSVWAYYHVMRIAQTGCCKTFTKCARGVEDTDGDGIECCEVIKTIGKAWNDQKDRRSYVDPDTKDERAAPNMSFSTRPQENKVPIAIRIHSLLNGLD